RELFEIAGLDEILDDPDTVLTVFVPTDEAIEIAAGGQGAPDFSDPDVIRPILEGHLHLGDAYDSLDGLSEIEVENGGPQPVTDDPPTFGVTPRPANVLVSATSPSNGVIHVIDQVVAPQP
ncbi:MAG: fasciclin domain-containing protein, partial [Acidimicrobiia bacterium]